MAEGLALARIAKLSVAENAANAAADLGANDNAPPTTTDKVKSIEIAAATGQITITYGTKIEDGKKIVLVPNADGAAIANNVVSSGVITWSCNGAGTDLAAKYRPAECR